MVNQERELMPSKREQLLLRSQLLVPCRTIGRVTTSSDGSGEAKPSDFYVKASDFPILTTDVNIKHHRDQQYESCANNE